jgi:glutamate--cysteine ligase
MANVSLEPGGQFQLSGAPLETIHDICETGQHLQEVKTVADRLELGPGPGLPRSGGATRSR